MALNLSCSSLVILSVLPKCVALMFKQRILKASMICADASVAFPELDLRNSRTLNTGIVAWL